MSYGKLMGRLITELLDVENRLSQLLHVQIRVNVHVVRYSRITVECVARIMAQVQNGFCLNRDSA